MDLGIAGKVALVTAASKGLGRASAMALAEEGVTLAICARGEEALQATEAELSGLTEVLAIVSDVTDPAAPAALVAQTVERFGALDILVANCGGPPPARSLEVDEEGFARALNSNFLTSARLVKEAVPHMQARRWGRVCLLTSSSIKQPIPNLSMSNAARTSLWAWAKTAATDVFDDGITINTVCPGLHNTDRIKQLSLGEGVPVGDPADFGKVVAFVCSQPAAFLSGTAILVDGARYAGLF